MFYLGSRPIDDLSGKDVHVDTSTQENVNAMVAIKKRSIRSSFQTAGPSRQQRTLESIRLDLG